MEANHFKIYRLFRFILLLGIFLNIAKTTWSQNYALSFDGSGDYVAFGNPAGLQIAGSQTIEMWLYPQSLSARRNPLAKAYAGEGTITIETDGTLSYFYGTGGGNNTPYMGFSSGSKLPVNTWTHVALVRDLSAMKLYWYFNGIEVAETPASFTYAQIGTLPFYIGRGYVSDFHGRIDEVRIWNVARTHSDIAAVYDESLTGSETGLAAYWPFDEGSGNTIYDKTSNGINGTRNGNAAFVTSAAPINPPSPGTEAFEPVPPTGLPYNIVLSNLTINGSELPVGAQIGVFDGELCVGSAFYTGNPNQNLVAWKADPTQNLAGFTAGNAMIFKVRTPWHAEVRVFDPELTMLKGNGTFGYGSFSVVNLAVTTSLVPAFDISAEILNFNTVIVNQSLTLPLVFENTGTAILSVNSMLNSSTHFVKSATAFLVNPGESATLNITFTPTSVTTYSDVLTFVTDDPDLPSMSVPLYGTGLPQATPQIIVTPSNLNFGGIAKNTTKTMSLNVLNTGNGTLNVTGITSSNPAFTVFGSTTFSLGQGENRNVSVVFAPTQAGVYNGQLTIANNAQNKTIPLAGIASQGHFTSVSPTGKPYTIVVEDVDIDGFTPLSGDEIAVFDGSLCVGTGISGGNGNSLALNGSNSFVINENSAAFDLNQMTISAWVYSTGFSQNGFIFEKGPVNSQYSLFFEGNNINFRTMPTSGGYNDFYVSLSTAGIQNNQWNHIAATYDGISKKLYVNGQLKATQAYTATLTTGQAGQIIGAYGGTGSHSYFFNGNIDEVRVYDYARSVFEIESDMYNELNGTESGLVGYWNFNNGNIDNLVPGSTPSSLSGGASLQGAQNPQIFSSLIITAWEKDEALGLPGFTSGNSMSFKVWTEIYDNWVEVNATPEYLVGNGNFGFGQMSVLTLEGTSGLQPDISVPIQNLYVGQVTVGSSVVNSVQITNEGNAPLHITLGDNSAAFSTSITTATVLPGNPLTFQVTFSPSVPGGYSGELIIQSNDPDEPQVAIGLEGFALPAGAANMATSVNAISFENVETGTSKTLSLFVINTGTTPLTVSGITFSDAAFTASPASFSLQNTNDLKEVFVTFQPDEKGTFDATMAINSNAGQKQVLLSGIGFDNHFNVVGPTGLPYTVIVRETNLGDLLQPGDELGVFDGPVCVGLNAPFTGNLVLNLDGNGDYVEIPDSPSLDLNGNQMTVEAWIKVNSFAGDYRCIIGKIGWSNSSDWSYNFHITDNGALHFNFINTAGTSFPVNSPVAVPVNEWHHVAATYNGSQIKLFIDGLQVASLAASGNIRQNNQVVKIGSWWSSDPNYFDGKLNEVRLWNYARSQSQIQASMDEMLTGTESGLAGYWNFDSNTANDLSQNGNHGTFVGNASVTPEWILSANQSITAWQADPANGLPGFTPGHPMSFKLWTDINGFPTELSATPTFIVGNGNFGFGQFSVVDLEFGFAGISVEPEEIFVSLEEPDSTQRVVTISNTGNIQLQFESSLTNISSPMSGWVDVSPVANVVSPGSTTELLLEFNSTGLIDGIYSADLIISNNTPENSLISLPLVLNVTGNPQISSSPASVDFSQVVVNETSEISLLLKNIGTKDMIISNISISNGTTTGFDFELPSKSFPLTLNPGQATEVILNFTPVAPGQVSDDLVVESNAGNYPVFTIPLTGEGITPPEIFLPQSAFTYTLPCNDEFTNGMKIKNLGQNSLQVSLTPGEDWLTVSPAMATIAGGDSTEIAVTVSTLDLFAGLHTATVGIASNDPENPVTEVIYSVTITGDPAILCNDFINIGTAFVGDTLVGQLTIANSGCDVLEVLSVGVQSQFPVFFVNNPNFQVEPGQASVLEISFVPAATAQYSGIITINSNDPANAAIPVVISAAGVQPPALSVNPLSLNATVQSGNSTQKSFVVKNTGGQVLNFTSSANDINPFMLKLDGNGDYINVVNSPDLNPANEITLEAWVYLYDNTNEFIIGKENSTEGKYRLLVNGSNRFEFELNNQFMVTSSLIASKNQWYHVAATFDGSTMSLFVNGNLDVQHTFAPFTIQPNTDNLRIGRSYQFAYFNGLMDEVRIWNIARNQSEIQSAMNQALLGSEPELLLYFPFANASGNIVTDGSSYGHNGILYGNPVRQASTVPFADYLSISNGNGNLNASQQQSVNLGLNSTGFFAKTYQRQIAVNSNAPSNPSAVVSLSLTIDGDGNVAANPTQVAFENTFIGLKDTFELVLENAGAKAVPVSDIVFSSPVFSSLNQVNKVFPFSQKVLKLVFEPTLAQLFEGSLTISLGNSKSAQLIIPLSGLGVTPPIPVLNPPAADFGNVVVSHTGEVTITLSNAGNSALVVNSFSIPGSPLFSSSLQLPQTISYNQQIQFDISFAPVNYDPVSAEMLISSNIGLISIPLSGTGVPPDHDLSVTGIITPENDCGLSNAEVLKISVKNFGVLPQSNFNVGFRLDNGAVVTENISGTLPSGQSMVYTFGQTLNLSVVKSYNLEVFTLLGNDQNTWNDTLTQTITNFPSVGLVSGLLPADSTFGVVEPVSFSWAPTPNATAYDLYLWRTSQPKPTVPTVAGITGTSFTYTQYLNKNYLYNWQIVARNQCSQSESDVQLFAFNVFSDLTVTQVTAPMSASSGQYVDITFTVSNTGTGGTGIIPWKDDIYISTSPVFSPASAVKIATVNNKSALNQGQSYTNTASIKLADYLEGEFWVFVVTDANNIIQETNETNNVNDAENTMNVNLPPYPDLTVGNIQSLRGNIIPGQTVTIGWDVENIGDAPAIGGWSQRVALVQGNQIQILGYVQNTESLDPAGMIARSASFQVPNQINFEGDIFVQVRLTPNPGLVEKPNGTENNTALSSSAVLLEKRLTLSIPQASLPENASYPLNCMIFRSGYLSQPLVVSLSVSENGRIAIPATVTIPANQAGAPFTISAINNGIIEGNINLVISAAGAGFPVSTANLTIVDDEIPALSASFNMATADEGAILQLTVTRDLVTSNPLTVNLFTMKPNQITIPGTLTIPANEASAAIDVPVIDNTTPELTETVTVTASSAGYTSGSAQVTILDDDLPQIVLTINPATVSEGGGTYAAWGTVTLDEPASGNVQVMISASPAGQLFFPSQITITNGQLQQQFNIGVVDNGILDGDRTVAVTAAVYISSCGCGAPPETGGAVTQNITILDNDGPSLTVGSTPYLVNENLVNAGYLTITRNTLGGNEITVNIQHNGADEIQIATSATIPEGATSVNVPFNTLDDGIEDGDQIVTVTVSSPEYSSGSCWVIVSDRNLPDYVARGLELSQNAILINDPVDISFYVVNEGFSLGSDGVEVKIYRSDDATIGAGDVLLSTQYTVNVLNIGDSAKIDLIYTPVDKVGNFYIIANVNANGGKNELLNINNTTQALALSVLPDYTASASVSGDVFNGTTPITITGTTQTVVKSPAPNKPVDVYIVVNGAKRILNAVSDNNGEFSVNFYPLNGEAGSYFIGACYPGQNLNEPQDEFTILGARTNINDYITWTMWLNETRQFFLEIKNNSPLDLSNVRVEVISGPPGCQVTFTPIAALPGDAFATLSYTVHATEVTTGNLYQEVKLQLVSDEGTRYRFSAWFFSQATMGNLKLEPVSLNKAMVKGITNYAEFTVRNNGLDSTGIISIMLPQNNWMSLASTSNTISSLDPGETAVVTLRLTPGEDLQLNNPITGQIALSGTHSNSVALPFSFEPVSTETGDLLVDVVDEYTYNTEAAPHLEGATVVITHPYTGQIIAQGTSDANGHFLAEDINEGYYILRVTAPQHGSYQNTIFIEKGITNTQVTFLAFQAITYSWEVVPTMIEDEYEINLVVVFETNVPAPVVVMSMPDTMPQLNFGEVYPFLLIMTNHGLITAEDVEVTFPQDDEYEFIANVNMLNILPQSSVQIPVIMQRRAPTSAPGKSSNCSDYTIASYKFQCGPDNQMRIVQDQVYYQGRYCGGSGSGNGGPGGGWGWCYDCGGYGPGYGPGGGTGPVFPFEIPTAPYQQSNVGCDPCLADFLNALWDCSPIPNIGIGKGPVLSGSTSGFSKLVDLGKKLAPWKKLFDKLKCAFNIGWSLGCKINQAIGNAPLAAGSAPPEVIQAQEDLFMVDKGFTATENLIYEVYNNEIMIERVDFPIFNDSVNYNIETLSPIGSLRLNDLLNAFNESDILQDEITGFVNRWNTSLEAYDAGIYSPTPAYPNIIDTLLIYNYSLTYDTAFNYALERGFGSIEEMYNWAYEIVEGYTEETSSSVCATVTVQFSQQLTMTREAFEGTLTIFNGHETDAMQNILLDLEIKDEDGFLKNDLFQINTQALNQITGIDGNGSLNSQTEGTAVIMFIPERGAAPNVPKFYSFGGTLSYLDPFTGEMFEQPLFPVTLQVNPSPNLYIDYFMQRDILGDDALTEPIEPMVPAELAVMIDNQGAGTAYSVKIESAQPEIIENEKGLLIDFEIVGSNLAGKPKQLGLLDVNFGDIPGGDIAVGQWWFTSTLLGHFISYEVTVNHLNSFGNPELSLVSDVQLHELIKSVSVYGVHYDSINDFLVNDVPDTDDIPDALYYSNGIVAQVVEADDSETDGQVSLNDLEIELTVTPSSDGWNYTKLDDPGNGFFRIVSCTREDGQQIPLENIWLTWVTIPDGGEPVYENKLHLLDYFDEATPISYTVVFEAIDQNFPEVVAFAGIPTGVTDTPVTDVEVIFNKPIDPATYDYHDMTLKNQGGPNLMDSTVIVTQLTDTTFNVDISSKTSANGFYVMTVQAAGIADLIGNFGQVGKQVSWIQAISTPAIDHFFGLPEDGEPTDTLLVLFNMPINETTFTTSQLVLTGPDGNNIPTGTLTITSESFNNVLFKISGLLALTSGDGDYDLTFKVTEIQGETGLAGLLDQTVAWTVCQIPLPVADAGDNGSVCTGGAYQLEGSVQNAGALVWTSNGTGTFNNNQVLNPVYTPSLADISLGTVEITLTAQPLNECAAAVSSTIVLTIKNAVEADAGDDATICQNTMYQLFGTVSHAQSFSWITSGNGTFNNPVSLTPVYTPGAIDIDAGLAVLSLVAEPQSPCTMADTASMNLVVQKLPSSFAGPNQNVCETSQVQLQGTAQNYNSVYWYGGQGTMSDRTILNPVYTFSAEDIERGYVNFLLTVEALSPCYTKAYSVTHVNVKKAPVANAGMNTTICENQTLQLSGSVQYQSSFAWSTSGDGTFSSAGSLAPIYTPGALDIAAGSLEISLSAQPVAPCQLPDVSSLTVTLQQQPAANAGDDALICENETIQLSGSVQNNAGFYWQTSGDGTFSATNSLSPVYTPGPSDISEGGVDLILTATPVAPCLVSVVATMSLEIQGLPVSDAGENVYICENQTVQLSGNVVNAGSFYWQTSGDGQFSSTSSLAAVYTPGTGDIAAATVELTLTAEPVAPCTLNDVSAITVGISYLPTASAGSDATVCYGELVALAGNVENSESSVWETTGDGTFDNSASLSANYQPGYADLQNGQVTLTLNALPVSPCDVSASDDLTITVKHCQNLTIPAGWSGISGFVQPDESSLENMFSDVLDDLVILQTETGMYWPGQNVNTIGNWNRNEGYKIKAENEIQLDFAGQWTGDNDLPLNENWNLIPVLSSCQVNVDDLFDGTGVTIVKEVAGWRVYWPGQGINTLGMVDPGKAYFVRMPGSASITFPNCETGQFKTGNADIPERFMYFSAKENTGFTPFTHTIAFSEGFQFEPGTQILAYDEQGNCCGIVESQSNRTALTIFGDDPFTTVKDGASEGEMLTFVMISPDGFEQVMNVLWDESLPNADGRFYHHGLSAMKEASLNAHYDFTGTDEITIFPNPTKEFVVVASKCGTEMNIQFMNQVGVNCLETETAEPVVKIDVSHLAKGIYMVIITCENETVVRKLVVE